MTLIGIPSDLTDPNIPSDVLASKQFQTLVELLGEGEIEGFPSATGSKGSTEYNTSALKDVFLNSVQVLQQNAGTTPIDSDFNFQNVSFEPRFGTSSQTPIKNISESETESSVQQTVTTSSPVSVSITNTNIDAVRVTVAFPELQEFTDDGDINGAEVELNIQTIENDGTTQTVITDTVKGRTASVYFRDYKINLPSGISFPVTVRVNRVTADSTDTKLRNLLVFANFTEIINDQKTYDNSAYIGLRFDAETFPSTPKRSYRVRGTKIKIPHNGTVRSDGSIEYSGTFNGTFKTDKEYSNDPAWILYDLLTTSKGFGDQIDTTNLDVFSFYSASVYASELVDDMTGTGNTEPRFSCNVVIQNQKQAYTLINELCSVMRVMPFYSAGTVALGVDRPTDASYLFNLSNVTDAGFSYSNTSLRTKHSRVNVAYFDMDTRTIEYETVVDTALENKYGIVVKNLKAIATTSRGQAARLGKWFLYTQNNESEIVTFITTLEAGTLVRPSQVILIADPMRAGVRRGGRIQSAASTTVVTVDDEHNTDLVSVNNATLSVILSDGTLETRAISSITNRTITVSSAFSSVPQANSVWVIENTTVENQTFRVIGVTEVDQLAYQITAVAHNPSKYANVEDGSILQTKSITILTELKNAPSNLQASEQIIEINNRAVSKLFIQWQPVSGVTEYMVQYRFQNENFITQKISSPDFTIFETKVGTYEVRVFSYNALGKPSTTPAQTTFTTLGKTALPSSPTGLTSEPVSESFIRLRFNQSSDIDVLHGGNVVVRHTANTDGTTTNFVNACDIIPALAGNVSETLVPALTGTYFIKFRDDGGRLSPDAAKIIVQQPEPRPNQIILTEREDSDSPPFQGEKLRTVYNANFDGLVLDGTGFFDNVLDVDSISNFDFGSAGISTFGTYDFQNIVDLGAIFNLTLKRHFITAGITVNDLFDSRLSLIDQFLDFDGAAAENCNASLFVSTSQGDPAISTAATYSQTQDLITLNSNSHGAAVGDNFRLNFTSGTADDGFLKVQSVTNANVCVLEAKRQIAEYATVNVAVGEIRFFTDGTYGGLSVGDTVNLRFISGDAENGDYIVGTLLPFGTVSISTSSNTFSTSGIVEFVKVKDSSGNNVTTSGNCNRSAAFSPFNIFANGEFTARGFKFKTELTTTDQDETINVSELGFEASVQQRTETVNTAIASACATNNSAKTITFTDPFFTGTGSLGGSTSAFLPTIGITLEGAVSGDYFKITSITSTQFVIETRDSSNAFKDLSFKYTAVGFGKGG
jgi:predicted phage tail protein